MKFLITGNKGQLGSAFVNKLTEKKQAFFGVDIEEIDISNLSEVLSLFENTKPDVLVNCAAYNLVDKAENDWDDAFMANALGVRNLAYACKIHKTFLVHYGTDYVFDGTKRTGLYTEEDQPNPKTIYGKSKLLGENLLKKELKSYLIFRLSWVFGSGTQNFIYKLKAWTDKNDILSIVYDEISSPTYTETVVDVTLEAIRQNKRGLYHLCNEDYCSRYEWAKFILNELGIKKFIYPCSIKEFNLPTPRPAFSAMSSEKICNELGLTLPNWKEATHIFINKQE